MVKRGGGSLPNGWEDYVPQTMVIPTGICYVCVPTVLFMCINPNHPKSIKILQVALFLEKSNAVVNWYFHLFKWGKVTTCTWQEVQAVSAEYERSMKMHGAF